MTDSQPKIPEKFSFEEPSRAHFASGRKLFATQRRTQTDERNVPQTFGKAQKAVSAAM